ncbi:hypothetical protein JR316_0011174 [Psilocybe cubensis]|uniref:Uncharacterized protein n=2 Tax=Psilocybe cubensis TaxID=181762 RepID=A0ACB8GP47_PSICU|nr:hypothetical protein JR316_0011174 [Psilocybe cubensis]KAH9477255.1 hypothetical protein JR316_0011174 [Psilocybe cubensis]
MNQFANASNLLITGGSFSQTQNNYGVQKDALSNLEKYIAEDASFDSAARYPPATCHPGTREKIIETILKWIKDPNPEKQALWLNGPAGSGKSAIGHSVASKLKDELESQKYGSTFFFAKGAPGRGDGNKLFPTIAYELATIFPEYRAVLNAVLQENPTLPSKSIQIQLHNLLIRPLRKVSQWPRHHPAVIIDGLDECSGGIKMQVAILSTIANAIIQHRIPLRFFIISRPEYWIADIFEIGCFSPIVTRLCLRDDNEADAGITVYLRDEFKNIYDRNIDVMRSIPQPWPEQHIIDRFVWSASGQYIYASTVIKFVGESDHCIPSEQLRLLTKAGPHEASAFSDLDRLYAAILSSYPRWDPLKRVISAILLNCSISEAVMEHIFDVPQTELRQILRSMRSLISKTQFNSPPLLQKLEPIFGSPAYKKNWLWFHHLSFREFIENDSRSGRFVVDKLSTGFTVWCVFIRHLRGLLQGDSAVQQILKHIGVSQYRQCLDTMGHILLPKYFNRPTKYGTKILIQEFETLLGGLDIVSQTNPKVPYANYAVLILEKLKNFLKKCMGLPMRRRKLFKTLGNSVDLVLVTLAQQVLETTAMDEKLFSKLVTDTWIDRGLQFRIATLCKYSYTTEESIVPDLQKMNGVVTLYFDSDSDWGIEIVLHFAEHQTHTDLETDLLLEWEEEILSILGTMFSDNFDTDDPDIGHMVYLTCFILNPQISDIRNRDRLENEDMMTILRVLASPNFPSERSSHHAQYIFMSLRWTIRQLSGSNRSVIEQTNCTLIGEMEAVIKAKFHVLVDLYAAPATEVMSDNVFENFPILPPSPDGKYVFKYSIHADGFRYSGLTYFLEFASENLHVLPPDIYPHIPSFLLKAIVIALYNIAYSNVLASWEDEQLDEVTVTAPQLFQLLLQWMSYALPTEENLNTIRLMSCIWHEIIEGNYDQPIFPPPLCNLIMEFLTKYSPSMLPGSELGHLNSWLVRLRDTDHPMENDSTTDEDKSDEDENSASDEESSGDE